MALNITATETRYEVANRLSDIDIKFISIVPHAAVREPFVLVKGTDATGNITTGDNDMAGPIVQSFVLPNTTEFEQLKAQPGMEWLAEIDFSKAVKKEYANFTRYTVLDKSAFKAESFDTRPVGEGWAVVGELEKEIEMGALQKGVAIMVPDPYYSGNEPQISIGDLIRRETWAFTDSMDASFRQSFADPKKRKASVMNNLSNYWDALSTLLDSAPAGIVKYEKTEGREGKTVSDPTNPIEKSSVSKDAGANNTEDDMDKEQILAIFKEAREAEKAEDLAKAAAITVVGSSTGTEGVKAETVAALTKGITELTVAVTKIQGDVTELKEKGVVSAVDGTASANADATTTAPSVDVVKTIEKMQEQLTSLLHSTGAVAPRTDGEPVVTTVEKSVFDGAFARK